MGVGSVGDADWQAGYDKAMADVEPELNRLQAENTKLRQRLDEWHSAARYDVLMEGPRFQVWNLSQLNRCRRQYLDDAQAAETPKNNQKTAE